jgi:ribonuclease HI
MKRAVIHTDGASSGNPGASGIGVVIEFGNKTYEHSAYIGVATNNVAEYEALIRGLEEALALGAQEVEARMDSELLAKQLSGEYRVKHPGLLPLYQKVLRLVASFRRVTFAHVPRQENKRADKLAKDAVRKAPKGSPDQPPQAPPGRLF